jgi:hypothetical protein
MYNYGTSFSIDTPGKQKLAQRRSFVASPISQAMTCISEDDILVLFVSKHIWSFHLILLIAAAFLHLFLPLFRSICFKLRILGGLISLFFVGDLAFERLVSWLSRADNTSPS